MAMNDDSTQDIELHASDSARLRLVGYVCGQNPGRIFDEPCCSKTTAVYRLVPKVEQAVEGTL